MDIVEKVWSKNKLRIELVSKELNHLVAILHVYAAILHVYARGLISMK